MSRSIERSERKEEPVSARLKSNRPVERGVSRRGGRAGNEPLASPIEKGGQASAAPLSGPERQLENDREARLRNTTRGGRRVYSVNADERLTMNDLGRFRTISVADLGELRYRGDNPRMRQDLRSLLAQGLIERKTVWTGRHREKETFYALTQAGKRLVKRRHDLPAGQFLYAGFVKSAELRHDAAIYRMYHLEAERITREGGRIRRVVLDFELKKKAYSPLSKAKALSASEYAKRQAEIAGEHGLKVVNGHIALPDLRIEYETRSGASAQVDLEVASESYHGSHAAEKAAAGFTIYAAPAVARRLSAALDEREITADILYL